MCTRAFLKYVEGHHRLKSRSNSFRLEVSENLEPKSDRDGYNEQLRGIGKLSIASALVSASFVAPYVASATDAIGYKAAISPFAPSRDLSIIPLLPQSALLNSLPLENALIGELQAYLESFLLLLNPSSALEKQVSQRDSILWDNLRINAQRAAGMFIYNRDQLLPLGNSEEPAEIKKLREQYGQQYLNGLQKDVIKLVGASRKASVLESLRCMRYALNSLCNVAYLLVDSKDCKKSLLAATEELSQSQSRLQGATEMESNIFNNGVMPNDEIKLPTLEGRATVILEFYRPRTEAGINDTTGTDGIIGKRARRTSNGVILDNIGWSLYAACDTP